MRTKKEKIISFVITIVAVIVVVISYFRNETSHWEPHTVSTNGDKEAYAVINNNVPFFTENDLTTQSYEYYSELDAYGRCGYVLACIGVDLMPTKDRESISEVKPSGWKQKTYDFIEGGSLYNRCHLIGFQLTGENANERNLITGTRYLNIKGMLPFENMIADYVKETENHVLYRVTPDFKDGEMVVRGVQMEALSVEDNGDGICFNVYAYNIQPGVIIDYTDGSSYGESEGPPPTQTEATENTEIIDIVYILNLKGMKFHLASCKQGQSIHKDNRKDYSGKRDELLEQGYVPAGCCNP